MMRVSLLLFLIVIILSSSRTASKTVGHEPGQPNKKRNTRRDVTDHLRFAVAFDQSIDPSDETAYVDFLAKHGELNKYDINNYPEMRKRYKLYQENKKKIEELNKNTKKKVTNGKIFEQRYGETMFMDWTKEEIQNILLNPVDDEKDRRRLAETECYQYAGFTDGDNSDIDTNVYYYGCGPVKSQGTANTCWVFGAVGQAECNYNYQQLESVQFSEQHILDCSGDDVGSAEGGGHGETVVEWVQEDTNDGYCEYYQYSYDGLDYDENTRCGYCYTQNKPLFCVELSNPLDWDAVTKSAISFAFEFEMLVPDDFSLLKSDGVNALVFFGCDVLPENGHVMVVTGQAYGQYVLVKNSWGTDWGDNGYIWIYMDAITDTCTRYPYLSFTMNYWDWAW